ncbi:MAG: hypothetical protein V1690_03340 [Candidatus Moraniibacteriota bacterium]
MNNNDNQADSSSGQPEEKKAPGRTLDMQNIAISTMKEDMAKDNPPEEKKGGWFDFMAKHKESPQSARLPDGQAVRSPQPSPAEKGEASSPNSLTQALADKEPEGGSLDKELEEFKTEDEIKTEKPLSEDNPAVTPSETVEAPPNLPVVNKPSISKLEDKPVGKISGIAESAPLENITTTGEEKDEEEISIPDIQGKLKEALGGELSYESVNKIKPVTDGGMAGDVVESPFAEKINGDSPDNLQNGSVEKNPFSSRIQPVEKENKSLLSSVEAALNYSAPPEFTQERENLGAKAASGSEGEGAVVDLRKKVSGGPLDMLMANKKLLITIGGVVGLVLVIGIILMFTLGGKTQVATKPLITAPQENKNANTAVVPIKPVVQTPPTVTTKKVLTNALEVPIEAIGDISSQMEKYRQGQTVSKQSQLVFQKADGSGATFQDLMDATGIMIPRNILSQPSTEAALVFTDFFHGNTVFGLIIPIKDSKELALSKLKDWESTMIIDLSDLWKGINIDNKGAYFADSQIFSGGRFALIDKKLGLSLDYLVQNGYVLIAPGKDSMTILQSQFNPPADGSGGTGIKWEEESSTTVSGTSATNSNTNVNSNDNTAVESNVNVNSQ